MPNRLNSSVILMSIPCYQFRLCINSNSIALKQAWIPYGCLNWNAISITRVCRTTLESMEYFSLGTPVYHFSLTLTRFKFDGTVTNHAACKIHGTIEEEILDTRRISHWLINQRCRSFPICNTFYTFISNKLYHPLGAWLRWLWSQ